MSTRRLGLGPYLLLWAVLTGAQLYAFSVFSAQVGTALGLALVLQLAKVPVAAMRLRDLGHPADDALLALIPLTNLGLWNQLNRRTPDEATRERARARWAGQMSATGAYLLGVRTLLGAGGTLLPIIAVFGAAFAGGELLLVDLLLQAPPGGTVSQAIGALALLVGLYTTVQVLKRKTATRASWLPTFLLPPLLLAWGAIQVGAPAGSGAEAGMAPLVLSTSAWSLGWMCIAGSALAVLFVSAVQARRAGRPFGLGDAVTRMATRTADVAAVHGGAALAIQVGMQVIIPGIHYALQFAFVDAIAVTDPTVPAFKRSTDLSRGIRRRVFKVYALGFLVGMVGAILAALPVELWVHHADQAPSQTIAGVLGGVPTLLLVMPVQLTPLSAWALAVVSMATATAWGAGRAGLAHMYFEQAERAAQAHVKAAGE